MTEQCSTEKSAAVGSEDSLVIKAGDDCGLREVQEIQVPPDEFAPRMVGLFQEAGLAEAKAKKSSAKRWPGAVAAHFDDGSEGALPG